MRSSPAVTQLLEESLALERKGDIAAALQRAQQAMEKAGTLGDPSVRAAALATLGFVHFRQGHYTTACSLAEEALLQAGPETPARVDALLVLGMCATETDDLTAGADYYHRAIDLGRQLGYHRVVLRALHDLAAGVYMPRGQFDLALASDEEALHIALEKGQNEYAVFPLVVMALVYWLTSRREEAYARLEALRRLVSPGALAEGWYYYLKGNLAQEESALDEALRLYAQARSIAEAIGEPGLNVSVRLGLSRYHRARGEAPAARAWAEDALTVARRVNYRHFQGIALNERGRAAWLCGDLLAAEADLRTAIEVLSPLEAAFDLARARLWLAALLHSQQRSEADAAWREAACEIVRHGYAFLLEQERALAFPLVAAYLKSADPEIRELSATLGTIVLRRTPMFSTGNYRLELYLADRLAATADFALTGWPKKPTFSPITFAEGVDRQGRPVRPGTTFGSGLKELYAFFDYDGMQDGWGWSWSWYLDGKLLTEARHTWEFGERGQNAWVRIRSKEALPDGRYGLYLFVEGEFAQYGDCSVGGRRAESPPAPEGEVEVQGRISDAETKKGIPDALFLVLQPGITVDAFRWKEDQVYALAASDRRGYFELPVRLRRGETYSWIITARGYKPILEDGITIGADLASPYELNITLQRVMR